MDYYSACAQAHPNIAFIKYWGDTDSELHLPENGSISMNLANLSIRMSCKFIPGLQNDTLTINQIPASNYQFERVAAFMNKFRSIYNIPFHAQLKSWMYFPSEGGLASSAAAFSALAAVATKAAGLSLSERELTRLARLGSGSASRSIPAGFVEWRNGRTDAESYAYTIAPADHWDLVDSIVIVDKTPKTHSSLKGHQLAHSSILQSARVADAPRRLQICRKAILDKDFEALAEISELDSNLLHAITMTSQPKIFYWSPVSLTIMQETIRLRHSGIPVFYTLDAGANVHLISPQEYCAIVNYHYESIPGVDEIIQSATGGGVQVFEGEFCPGDISIGNCN